MRVVVLLIAIFVAFPAFGNVHCTSDHREITAAVAALTVDTPREQIVESFSTFKAHPLESACQLVGELAVVRARIIRNDQESRFKQALHVVWALRALRYVTGCREFYGRTREKFASQGELDRVRVQFLTRDRRQGEVPFFSVWMSRDMVFLAASDAQRDIIRQWNVWLSSNPDFDSGGCDLASYRWYF
jgi:hypothetical protein